MTRTDPHDPSGTAPRPIEVRRTQARPDGLAALLAEATAADGVPPISDGLLDAIDAPGSLKWEATTDDGLAGFGIVTVQGERGAAEAVLAPGLRGHGAGRTLIAAMEAGARAAAAAGRIPATWFWSHGDHPAAAALASGAGYARGRELLQLTTDPLADVVLPDAEAPDGVMIRDFAPGDEAEWLRVNNAAFDWHPEQGGQRPEDIAAIVADPGFSPAHVLMAVRDGRIAGFHQLAMHTDHPAGLVTGEVYVIGVDPGVHARGIGRALTLAGMHRLRELGAEAIELYVEADNKPARRLYESLGFTHTIVHVSYAPPEAGEKSDGAPSATGGQPAGEED